MEILLTVRRRYDGWTNQETRYDGGRAKRKSEKAFHQVYMDIIILLKIA